MYIQIVIHQHIIYREVTFIWEVALYYIHVVEYAGMHVNVHLKQLNNYFLIPKNTIYLFFLTDCPDKFPMLLCDATPSCATCIITAGVQQTLTKDVCTYYQAIPLRKLHSSIGPYNT